MPAHAGISLAIQRAVDQLAKNYGPQEASRLVRECQQKVGLAEITCSQDLLLLAETMVWRGGLVAVVGRSLKVQALLGGARAAS